MALQVKLEYIAVKNSDDGVMWHLRIDPPAYIEQIGKESYFELPEDKQHPFLTGMFVAGVTEIASQAYRVYIMKSPVFNWLEVNNLLRDYLLTTFEEISIELLAGSGELDGTGLRLASEGNRRPL